ncbi:limonene-1,2-epoxide hydrolase [Sphingobium cupriresistens LL01]|uniref:Limonene-1,2-epoxide hydrolase n=2 Tax=Sphingobium cupriresistens TaxID=1132417 RepID=A0A0J8ARP8_9SPHN|nr:limonene-1,2-epoxide hydrolase [Sphingobium cupriresistens LL01]
MKCWGSNGNTVFTERVDWSRRNGKWSPVPLVAVFDLNDAGQIVAWREYLDLIHISQSHGMTADALIASLDLESQPGA